MRVLDRIEISVGIDAAPRFCAAFERPVAVRVLCVGGTETIVGYDADGNIPGYTPQIYVHDHPFSSAGIRVVLWRTYIVVNGKLVAERFLPNDGTASMRYFVLDRLGSVSVITDETGTVLNDGLGHDTGRLSYDSWGRMRNLDSSADTTCLLPAQSATTRSYTSQEEMPTVCLINYNAPLLRTPVRLRTIS